MKPNKKESRISSNPQDRLCELLLSWNIMNDIIEDNKIYTFNPIPLTFSSKTHYIESWEPLVIEEIKAGIINKVKSLMSSNKTNGNTGVVNVACIESSGLISKCVRLECQFNRNKNKNNEKSNEDRNDKKDQPSTLDLLLLCLNPIDLKLNNDSKQYFLGMISSNTRSDGSKGVQMKIYRSKWEELIQLDQNRKVITSGQSNNTNNKQGVSMKFHYVLLDSLISSWREFFALHETPFISPLINKILCESNDNSLSNDLNSPDLPLPINTADDILPDDFNIKGLTPQYADILKQSYNISQLQAIHYATSEERSSGFTLIQGPPGTGKTTTIIGILNTIHLREYTLYYDIAAHYLLSDTSIFKPMKLIYPMTTNIISSISMNNINCYIQLLQKISIYKPHILMLTPSNIAVDNVVSRLLSNNGFIDQNGNKYNPNIIRIGKSSNNPIVTLEEIIEQEIITIQSNSNIINSITNELNNILNECNRLRYLLLSLKYSFINYYLPKGWELRIDQSTALVYWVDHINKVTSNIPPADITNSKVDKSIQSINYQFYNKLSYNKEVIRNNDMLLDALPEYSIFCNQLIQQLEQFDMLYHKLLRYKLYSSMNLSSYSTNYVNRSNIENNIIDNAHIIFTTLNSSSNNILESMNCNVVIIDEAGQCIEPSVLIPLRKGCKQCIMVGDPKQLPATILSNHLSNTGFDRPLMERLIMNKFDYILLSIQYRMIPLISTFISDTFYNSLLVDAVNVTLDNYIPNYLSNSLSNKLDVNVDSNIVSLKRDFKGEQYDIRLKPFMFINIVYTNEHFNSTTYSYSNEDEIKLCYELLILLYNHSIIVKVPLGSIAIITPYSEQMNELRKRLVYYHQLSSLDIEINTFDGFQGKEKDIVIISTVRSNKNHNIGFLSDVRRLNVGITRAKFGLFILGNIDTLYDNKIWKKLINYLDMIQCIWNIDDIIKPLDIKDFIYSRNDFTEQNNPIIDNSDVNSQPINFLDFLNKKIDNTNDIINKKVSNDVRNIEEVVELEEGEVSE